MIKIEKPTENRLAEINKWDVWEKEPCVFDHHYDKNEHFYFLEGEAEISDQSGKTVVVNAGDLVTISQGADTTWKVIEKVRKHFLFF